MLRLMKRLLAMKNLMILLVLGLTVSSCSNRNVLNQSNIENYKLTFEHLNNIQFYNSHDIVLTRYENSTSDKSTSRGNLNVNYGKQIDQVVIKANTKGRIIKELDGARYAVSFEADPSKYLVFGKKSQFDVYYLQAIEWENKRGKVQYGDGIYYTHAGADECTLQFKLKRKFKEEREMRIAKGNKIK